ncbi:UNVERIFIED_CONTAM: hypothetical protein K2H54_061203 [Gekko kuhli]
MMTVTGSPEDALFSANKENIKKILTILTAQGSLPLWEKGWSRSTTLKRAAAGRVARWGGNGFFVKLMFRVN